MRFTGKTKPWEATFPKHEPSYWYWLRFGGPCPVGPGGLLIARTWIAINSPRRRAGRWLRKRGWRVEGR